MLVSYNWLQDFIKEPLPDPARIKEAFTMHSFEVEDVSTVGLVYPGVVVGRIERIEAHPNADKLRVTRVDIGDGELRQIICGAANIEEGQLVPVATVGTTLLTGTEIKEAEIRDVRSYGMICFKAELGLEDESDGIWPLASGAPGQLLDELLETGTDTVFDIDVLPNRASDCLSHRGVARELAATLGLTFNDAGAMLSETGGHDLSVEIADTGRCRRYTGASLSGISVGASPAWLQQRLRAVGQRPINNVVDATNYVMLTFGQPMHAFDAQTLTDNVGCSVRVRAPHESETLTALDRQQYELPDEAAVIADGYSDTAIAIGGVIGGNDSAVGDQTRELVLEAASFDPATVRRTSKQLKLATDSSKRFENDVAPALTERAMAYLIELLSRIATDDGFRIETITDRYPVAHEPPTIVVTAKQVSAVLGTDVPADRIPVYLEPLGFSVERSGDQLSVQPPVERRDVTHPEDVIEEVGRLHGYSTIAEMKLPDAADEPPHLDQQYAFAHRLRDVLVSHGWSEVMTYALRENGELEIENPLAMDKAFYRRDLASGVRAALDDNNRYTDLLALDGVYIFEIGNVYTDGAERTRLALGARPGKGADTTAAATIHAAVARIERELGVKMPAPSDDRELYEIDIHEIERGESSIAIDDLARLDDRISFRSISPYPYVLRDVAVWVPSGTASGEPEEVIRASANAWLVNLYLFDAYERKEEDAVSYAFRLVFQSDERTLSDEEVNEVMEHVYNALQERDGWEIR